MAQRIQTMTYCDLCPAEETEAVDSVTVSMGKKTRKLDTCQPHYEEVTEAMERFLGLGRAVVSSETPPFEQRPRAQSAVPSPRAMTARPVAPTPRRASKADALTMNAREWGMAMGMQVAPRGKVPRVVVDAWEAAKRETGKRELQPV